MIGVLGAVLTASLTAWAATITQADPDACALLSNLDVEPLLFAGAGGVLESRSRHPGPGVSVCQWDARPNDHAADATPRVLFLGIYQRASVGDAQAELDHQPRGDGRPSLALIADGDTLVRPRPATVFARHGAVLAAIDASGAELARPDQIEARYLLDALALKAAGAPVRPPPWAKPGQVAGWAPIGEDATGRSIKGWAPPPHPAAAGSALLAPLIHALHVLAQLRFLIVFIAAPLAVLLLIFRSRASAFRPEIDDRFTRFAPRWPAFMAAGLIGFMVLNVIFGPATANLLINRFGEAGAAMVTGSFATSSQYNRRDVVGRDVLIRTHEGSNVESRFKTDDFNVDSLGDQVIYPGPGDVFTVRYLPSFPSDFVIRADDGSPWARSLACARLGAWRSEAQRRFDVAPQNVEFRGQLERARDAGSEAGCRT